MREGHRNQNNRLKTIVAMKTQSTIRKFFLAGSIAALLAAPYAQAATYTWDPSNVTGTPTATLDWFTGGANSLGKR